MMASRGLSWCVKRLLYRGNTLNNSALEIQSLPQTLTCARLFHSTPCLERSNRVHGTKCGGKDIFEANKIQDTMNKVMGARGPFKKVAYKPGLRQTSAASAVGKKDFLTLRRE